MAVKPVGMALVMTAVMMVMKEDNHPRFLYRMISFL
jgi:hypothetical protein